MITTDFTNYSVFCNNVDKIYNKQEEIKNKNLYNINLFVNHVQKISILGKSGYGKNTILNILGELDDVPKNGKVYINWFNIDCLSENKTKIFLNLLEEINKEFKMTYIIVIYDEDFAKK